MGVNMTKEMKDEIVKDMMIMVDTIADGAVLRFCTSEKDEEKGGHEHKIKGKECWQRKRRKICEKSEDEDAHKHN